MVCGLPHCVNGPLMDYAQSLVYLFRKREGLGTVIISQTAKGSNVNL